MKVHKVKVWDGSTRVFHWGLVGLIAGLWISAELGYMDWHTRFGYAVMVLLLFRWGWGFCGSFYSRFSEFVKKPGQVASYLQSRQRSGPVPSLGHNPLGGWMVVALLLTLSLQVTSGLLANDDIFTTGALAFLVSKEASDVLTTLHKGLFNVLLGLFALHVLAVIVHEMKGEKLVRAMIRGWKLSDEHIAVPAAGRGRVLLVWGLSLMMVLLMLKWAPVADF
ncbi:hypothetical protein WH50_06815 [Pokkaliibacter plantistimulans]|uniref:Cytochrome b561 bacterial/Ni-hydrogenase domain-containing protein n=1 Tax=Pokkaliibacter plantistimulans TaxID=1635171 RepID=A0ABX5LZC9_9GAMM|nr:hypothetical protein WH50_06815 [Pokkaliibacter plantistimulans]